jgi:hypothetical protein
VVTKSNDDAAEGSKKLARGPNVLLRRCYGVRRKYPVIGVRVCTVVGDHEDWSRSSAMCSVTSQ